VFLEVLVRPTLYVLLVLLSKDIDAQSVSSL
jgi:hypothetical protein